MAKTYTRIEEGSVPEGHAALECGWNFYYDHVPHKKSALDNFEENLKDLATVRSVEEFGDVFYQLKRPTVFPLEHDLYVFREHMQPLWEHHPDGGCWIIRVHRSNNTADKLWERIVFALVGEQLGFADVVGAVLSSRHKDDIIKVWNHNNVDCPTRHMVIGEKIKQALQLGDNTMIQYKANIDSLKDRSTCKNARAYAFVK